MSFPLETSPDKATSTSSKDEPPTSVRGEQPHAAGEHFAGAEPRDGGGQVPAAAALGAGAPPAPSKPSSAIWSAELFRPSVMYKGLVRTWGEDVGGED